MNNSVIALVFFFFAFIVWFVIGRTPSPIYWIIVTLDALLFCGFIYFGFLHH